MMPIPIVKDDARHRNPFSHPSHTDGHTDHPCNQELTHHVGVDRVVWVAEGDWGSESNQAYTDGPHDSAHKVLYE